MSKAFAVLAFALLLAAARISLTDAQIYALPELSKWKKPDFCGTLDCPRFTVDNTTDDYEIRTYDSGYWALVTVTETKYELAYTKAAAKLIRYFNGANDAKERLEHTTPLLAALKLDKTTETTERNYTFSMWLPKDYQNEDKKDLPVPNDEEVDIVDFPETTVYVRVFGGYATEASVLNEVRTLHEALEKDEEEYVEDCVFVAVYDPAIKLLNRHNEVHVMERDEAPDAARAASAEATTS